MPTSERTRCELPAYDRIDDALIVAGFLRNLHLAVTTLRSGVVPEWHSIWEAEVGTKKRTGAGQLAIRLTELLRRRLAQPSAG